MRLQVLRPRGTRSTSGDMPRSAKDSSSAAPQKRQAAGVIGGELHVARDLRERQRPRVAPCACALYQSTVHSSADSQPQARPPAEALARLRAVELRKCASCGCGAVGPPPSAPAAPRAESRSTTTVSTGTASSSSGRSSTPRRTRAAPRTAARRAEGSRRAARARAARGGSPADCAPSRLRRPPRRAPCPARAGRRPSRRRRSRCRRAPRRAPRRSRRTSAVGGGDELRAALAAAVGIVAAQRVALAVAPVPSRGSRSTCRS